LYPCLYDSEKDESKGSVEELPLGLFHCFFFSSARNNLDSREGKEEYGGTDYRNADKHEDSAFDRSVPFEEIYERVGSGLLDV
jgi:hypothetical protein